MVRLWPLYALAFLLLTLSVTLVASIPLFAQQLADESLKRELANTAVPRRNLLLQNPSGVPLPLNRLEEQLEPLFIEAFEMRQAVILGQSIIYHPDGQTQISGELLDFLNLNFYAFGGLDDHVVIVNGRLPRNTITEPAPPISLLDETAEPRLIEIAVGQSVVELLGLEIGDALVSFDEAWRFELVGIVEPLDPAAERWWGDEQLLPFNFWRRISLDPDFVEVNAGLLLHPETLDNAFSNNLHSWRILLDTAQIDAANATQLETALRNLETSLSSSRISASTGLTDLLITFNDNIVAGQRAMLLLITQSLLAVLYTLAILGRAVVSQSSGEIATLTARGIAPWRVFVQFMLRYLLLMLLAWPFGVWLATLLFPQPLIPSIVWWLGGGVLLFGLLALLLPIPGVVQRGVLGWVQQQSRPRSRQQWLRGFLFDMAVLLLGGLIFWQLRQFTQGDSDGALFADPLLLLGPTVLILGGALLLRHLVSPLIQGLAWFSRRSKRPLLPLALTWLGRERIRAERLIFLVSVATGLALFAALFTFALTQRQGEVARYLSGADLRWSVLQRDLPTITAVLQTNDNVTQFTTVFRDAASPVPPVGTEQLSLLAVSPEIGSIIAPYPAEFNPISIERVLTALENPAPDAVPAVLSRRNVIPGMGIGDRITLQVGTVQVPAEVRDIIESFSTLQSPFVVMNLEGLRPYLDQQGTDSRLAEQYELWAAVQPTPADVAAFRPLVTEFGDPFEPPLLLSDGAALHDRATNHLLARQIREVFQLNVAVMIVLSVVSLLLLQLLDGWKRRPLWGNLLAIGVSPRHIWTLLFSEGAALVSLGMLIGLGLGVLLAQIMQPLLTLTLTTSLGTPTTALLFFDSRLIGGVVALLLGLYLVAVLVAAGVNGRLRHVAQLLR